MSPDPRNTTLPSHLSPALRHYAYTYIAKGRGKRSEQVRSGRMRSSVTARDWKEKGRERWEGARESEKRKRKRRRKGRRAVKGWAVKGWAVKGWTLKGWAVKDWAVKNWVG